MASKPMDATTATAEREERIQNRKMNREKNSSKNAKHDYEETQGGTAHGTNKTGAHQVADSLFHLDKRKHTGLQNVTSVRVATDESESKRRIKDEDLRRERLAKLQHEALASAKANAAVEMKWAEILEKEIPQDLEHEINAQKDACDSIIKSKDELITEFQHQLRAKDEEYVRTLRQQAEDTDRLLERIRSEFREMNQEYDTELQSIEAAYEEERDRFIKEHTGEIEAMFESRKQKENSYIQNKQRTEMEYQKAIDDLITKGADEYNKLKIELELNIQTLKQQLEEIRATYQLNTERLQYNKDVLYELGKEKNDEWLLYKKRNATLKEQQTRLTAKYAEMEALDSKMNTELTEDYRSLTQKYKDLQAKFRHFEVADTNKYDEVWVMHEDEAKDLVDQLLKADQIITEQQLSWRWRRPDMASLAAVLGRHGTVAGGAPTSAAVATAQQGTEGESSEGRTKEGEEKEKGAEDGEDGEGTAAGNPKATVPGARIRGMLRLLASEAGFLINPDVASSIASLPDAEADVMKAETLLKALGVKSEDKLQTLVAYFFRDNMQGTAVSAQAMNGEDDELELRLHHESEDVAELKDMIRPEDVIAAVKAYIEDVMVDGPVTGMVSRKAREEEERIREKRLATIKSYWQHLSQVVSDESVETWRQLEMEYAKLKGMLGRRTTLVSEVDDMTARNIQLKRLLNQYLGDADINRTLQVPPAQVMKVRNVPTGSKGLSSTGMKKTKSLSLGKTL